VEVEIVEIEATNYCNTDCLHCPREALTRPMGKMSWDVFQTVADKILSHKPLKAVSFSGIGEPTLNPLLPRFVEYLSGQVSIALTTNAATLTERKARELIDAGLDKVLLSVNGHDQELYSLMMGGLSLEKVSRQVQRFVDMSAGKVQVLANVSVSRQTEAHLADIRRHLGTLGVHEVVFSQCHSRGGHLKAPSVCNTPPPPSGNGRCDVFASTLFVAWNGQVLACCHDLAAEGVIGNLLANDLATILERRRRITERGVSFSICRGCNDMYRFVDDALPGDTPLSEWLYALYTEKDPRAAALQEEIRKKEQRIRELEALVAAYEGGRFMRFMRWLHNLRP
jgi:sulfatase maturation enzyme AslB (radical SAM superfamily)